MGEGSTLENFSGDDVNEIGVDVAGRTYKTQSTNAYAKVWSVFSLQGFMDVHGKTSVERNDVGRLNVCPYRVSSDGLPGRRPLRAFYAVADQLPGDTDVADSEFSFVRCDLSRIRMLIEPDQSFARMRRPASVKANFEAEYGLARNTICGPLQRPAWMEI